MSQENVEIVKEFTQRFAAGDRRVARVLRSRNCLGYIGERDARGGRLPRSSGSGAFFRDWLAPWEDYEIETSDYIDAGDAVVLVFRQAGTGRGSGVRIERDFFGVWDLKDSKVVRFRLFESREQALEAAGLSGVGDVAGERGDRAAFL